jgi:hypothetical protein
MFGWKWRTYFMVFVRYQSTPPALWAWLTNQTGSQNSSQFLPEWVPWLSASSLNNFGNQEEFCHMLSPHRLWRGKFFTRRHYVKLFRTENEGWYFLTVHPLRQLYGLPTSSLPPHNLGYLVPRTLFAKGLNWMPGGFKVSNLLIDEMILFATISNLLKWKFIHIMAFNITYWGCLRW